MPETLYILMRNDVKSMNAGKGMAQAAHAANAFQTHMIYLENQLQKGIFNEQVDMKYNYNLLKRYDNWIEQGGTFGTTITLATDGTGLEYTVHNAKKLGFVADLVVDPSYPVRDGRVTHLVEFVTCGYVFAPNPEAPEAQIVRHFPLMR